MTLLFHVRVAGCLLFALAAMHFFLPKRFHWHDELARLSPLNRQIFLVHTFFIVLVLVMMGALSLFFGDLLLADAPLARVVLGALALFWLTRLLVQWLVYDWSLWRGDRFNTAMHVAFTALWSYLTGVYGAAFWSLVHR